ncbi:hypothetical protein H8S90_21295 [Olivibacter sp. SDN3]|uniref:hypothetical protein n=1 Tax=Olivibacter sp. SDN3 TaxID=2764720 RepID=UPI0016514C37|nr:hypothetical protein [Olivibacter sp. SDN3]QNL49248.1 hypothetical protein H8S90_21295 [Olivibacter sp. SDN3]
MPELKYVITARDDKSLEKALKRANKMAADAGKAMTDAADKGASGSKKQAEAAKEVTKAVQEQGEAAAKAAKDVTEGTDKATESVKKEAAALKEVDKAAKDAHDSLLSAAGAVKYMDEETQKLTQQNAKQLAVLSQVGNKYKNLVSDSISGFEALSATTQRQYDRLSKLEIELTNIAAAQKDLSKSYDSGNITQKQFLEGSRALSVQENETRQRISQLNAEIQRNSNIERAAIGSIAEKTAKLTQLQQEYTALSQAQRENEKVGGRLRKEYQALSKEVEGLNKDLQGSSVGGLGGLLTGLKGIAAAAGIAFGTQQLISFGMELFDIAKKSEGVRIAFARIGDSNDLQNLREATKGTVNDLELMQAAVRAKNFKIPLDVLAKGLQFAKQRASDTGKEVDFLVNSFVDGIGRKSSLVLDNLGISASELQQEIKKTGDFAQAAGNIIQREMEAGGRAVTTLSDRSSALATIWANLKTQIAGVFSSFDTDKIGRMTKAFERNNPIDRLNPEQRVRAIEIQGEKIIKVQQKIDELEEKASRRDASRTSGEQASIMAEIQRLREREQWLSNGLSYLREQNRELAKQERISNGLVSNEELKQQIQAKQLEADQLIVFGKYDEKRLKALNKEITDLQALLDKRTGKQDKKDSESAIKALEQEGKERKRILEQYADVTTEYTRKGMNEDEAQIQSVRDKYSKIRKIIADFNAKAKGEKIGLDGIDIDEQRAIDNLKYRQETERYMQSLEEQKVLFQNYESFKTKYGQDEADKRYSQDLDGFKSYVDKLQDEMKKLEDTGATRDLTGPEQERLKAQKEELKKANADVAKQEEQRYIEAFEAAITHNQRMLEIDRDYHTKVKALGETASKDQLAELKRVRDQRVSEETSANLAIINDWENMFSVMEGLGRKSVQTYLDQVQERVDAEHKAGKLSPKDYQEWIDKLNQSNEQLMHRNPFIALTTHIKRYIKALSDSNKKESEKLELLRKIGAAANVAFGDLNNVAYTLADGLREAGIGGDRLVETLGRVGNVLGGLSELGEGLATKNPVTIITGAIRTLSSVIGLFNTKDKRIQKQIEGYENALKSLERQYTQLQRSIENSVGNSFYDDSAAAVNNLRQQIKNLEAARDAESRKKKADQGKIEAYNDQINAVNNTIQDLQKSISENLLQTNFKTLSDNLANALLSAFEAGEDGIESMNKTFDAFIKNALANSLKLAMIEPLMEQMTKDLTDYMLNNNKSLVGYDFTGWRDQLNEAGKDFNKALEEAYKGLGLTTEKESQPRGMSGMIGRAITEDTANKWMGVQLNMYTIAKNQFAEIQSHSKLMQSYVSIAQKNLDTALGIERNTAETVGQLKVVVNRLDLVVTNTRPQYDLARNKGLG